MFDSANTEGQRHQRRALSAEGYLFLQCGYLPQCVAQRAPPGGLGETGWQGALIPGPHSALQLFQFGLN